MDVSDSASPREVAALATPGRASGVYVADGYAYVADWDGGLLIARIGGLRA